MHRAKLTASTQVACSLLLLAGLPFLCDCSSTSCTVAGCTSGVEGSVAWSVASLELPNAEVTVCRESHCTTANAVTDPDGADLYVAETSSWRVGLREYQVSILYVVPWHEANDKETYRWNIVSSQGKTLSAGEKEVSFSVPYSPNGASCGPTCRSAYFQ